MNERIDFLMTWTPFLLEGFALNVLIATCATVIGTLLGGLLALLRFSRSSLVVMAADRVSSFFRNIPTLVLMFYLATLIPNEVAVSETLTIEIPKWLKAAIAMCASPLGFTSWNLHTAMLLWKAGNRSTAIIFVPTWLSGFNITLLSSSTASLVGVNELVSRCNTVIAATNSGETMFIYVLASLIFILFSLLFSWVIGLLKARLLVIYA
jgi:polar amino acid transport system permease protein